MTTKKAKNLKNKLFLLCLAVLPAAAALMFILPQFAHANLIGGKDFIVGGFGLAFGFKDGIMKVPGKIWFFLPFLFGVITAALFLAQPFIKLLQKNAKIIYCASAVPALVSVVLTILYAATANSFDISESSLVLVYYFKIVDGHFTPWFWLGIVFHALTMIGCGYGFIKTKIDT